MTRRVSIIVCSYNAEADLRDCLESLERQDYPDIEIVIVNDASTDATAKYLETFESKTQAAAVIVTNNSNLGVAGSRNAGIRQATGEILAFLDADCVAERNWISELVQIYEQRTVAAVGGRIIDARVENIWSLSLKGHDYVATHEGCVAFVKGCNMSFESNVLRRFLFNDEIRYGYEELLLCDHLRNEGCVIYYTPRAIVHHKHRKNAVGIFKQKYLRGMSSVWYMRKQGKRLCVYKRHLLLLAAIAAVLISGGRAGFLYFSALCMLAFLSSLVREEILFSAKTFWETLVTFPFLIVLEFAHAAGSCAGFVKFVLLPHSRGNGSAVHP
jgi:glycosyltransferase involved in cell wall biosynthesis